MIDTESVGSITDVEEWPANTQYVLQQLQRSGYVKPIVIDRPTVTVCFLGLIDGINQHDLRELVFSLNAISDAGIPLIIDLSNVVRWTDILESAIRYDLVPAVHVQNAPHNVRDHEPLVIYCDSTLEEVRNILVQ